MHAVKVLIYTGIIIQYLSLNVDGFVGYFLLTEMQLLEELFLRNFAFAALIDVPWLLFRNAGS